MLLLDADIAQSPMDYSIELGCFITMPGRGAVSPKHIQAARSQNVSFQKDI